MLFENNLYNFLSFFCSRPTAVLQTFLVVFYFNSCGDFRMCVFKIEFFGCLVVLFVWDVIDFTDRRKIF